MPPRFCQACGGSLSPRAGHFVCDSCGRPTYLNSKPCAEALVVRDEKLLLIRRSAEPFLGWWDIPGGFLEAGEHPEAGVIRELREETGLEVRPLRIVAIAMDTYGAERLPTLSVAYECEVVGGEERAGDDADEIGWFPLDALPSEIAFEHAPKLIADWLASRRSSLDPA
jgi:8-oxo-dGTP diphosphatase